MRVTDLHSKQFWIPLRWSSSVTFVNLLTHCNTLYLKRLMYICANDQTLTNEKGENPEKQYQYKSWLSGV